MGGDLHRGFRVASNGFGWHLLLVFCELGHTKGAVLSGDEDI